MGRRKKKDIYGIYRGDEFIDVGTIEELAKSTGLKEETIRWFNTPTAKKRRINPENGLVVVLVQKDYYKPPPKKKKSKKKKKGKESKKG